MPSIYGLKPAFQNLLRPLTRALARRGVTANAVTLAAVVLSAAVGAAVALRPGERWPLLLIGPALLVRMALNAVDGMLAREHGMKSRLGAVLNELGDVVSDAALYLPLALVAAFEPALVVVFVLLAVIAEMTGVLGPTIGAGRRYDGPMGKSDRAAAIGVATLLIGLGVPAGRWPDILMAALCVLLVLTIVNRARGALRGSAA